MKSKAVGVFSPRPSLPSGADSPRPAAVKGAEEPEERALSKTKPLNGKFKRYRPGDHLLGFPDQSVAAPNYAEGLASPFCILSSYFGLKRDMSLATR